MSSQRVQELIDKDKQYTTNRTIEDARHTVRAMGLKILALERIVDECLDKIDELERQIKIGEGNNFT